MAKHGKKFRKAAAAVPAGPHPLAAAVKLAKDNAFVKFDESLDVAMRLGVDPKHADQMVRGTVVLPHGTGKTLRILVFASGDKLREAEEAGADFVGGDELAKKVEGGWLEFDAIVATPDMMRVVGRLGRVLGPRGLMPNPKTGTVTPDVAKAIGELKAGKVEFRTEKTGIVQAAVGKVSFSAEQLQANAEALIHAVLRAKPAAAKGKYVKSATVSTTMGPGLRLDEASITLAEA